ncbi:MAG: nitroreductase family deazaflavin-dependent oxidoreductase, partial [Actinobacteria bacterium]|nr:nitroreductase family deazaflavin-dependent oxidoreductase [Actinomycetota bacterium]
HNLVADPETTVQVGSEVLPVRARIAGAEERERLFARFVAIYPGYESYRERAHPRVISRSSSSSRAPRRPAGPPSGCRRGRRRRRSGPRGSPGHR